MPRPSRWPAPSATWKYQRWEDRAIWDWGFIQWGEFVSGGVLGIVAMTVLLLLTALMSPPSTS